MSILDLKNVSKWFGDDSDRVDVLHDIDLAVEEGEFVAIVGFSGSGKSTLISLMAGLEFPNRGEVTFRGETVEGPAPDRAVCFQSYSLMPWMTVKENILLAVDAVFGKESKAERNARAQKYIDMVSLSHAVDRRPAELSGGMRQSLCRPLMHLHGLTFRMRSPPSGNRTGRRSSSSQMMWMKPCFWRIVSSL